MSRPRAVLIAALLLAAVPASARADSYTRCPAVPGTSVAQVARASCADAAAAFAAVAAAPADQVAAALTAAGWQPTRAREVTGGFDVVAIRGRAALRVRRPGTAPDLDGWAAGRELVFSRRQLVGGKPIPRDAAGCTAAFVVRLANRSLGGLSAAHCAGVHSNGLVERRNAALRRPPQPGIVLGKVQRVVQRKAPLDALVLPVPQTPTRTVSAIVDRGVSRPPWIVAGVAKPTAGRRICLTGRTSGADRCGRILRLRGEAPVDGLRYGRGVDVVCTTARARPGDSGGPVYTRGGSDGRVRAVGLTDLAVGLFGNMCFTPIGPVLRKLDASVVTG